MPCRPVGLKRKPGHGPVVIKRVISGRWSDGPYHIRLARSPNRFSYIYFFHKFYVLITKLFNIIKFELKIYDFTLNNVIKIFYIIFCWVVSCRAGLIGSIIGPSRARPNGSCRAWHGGPEARPGHVLVRASGRDGPLSFKSGRVCVGPTSSCFEPTHLARPRWPGIPAARSAVSNERLNSASRENTTRRTSS
jgi:hypothetical protein